MRVFVCHLYNFVTVTVVETASCPSCVSPAWLVVALLGPELASAETENGAAAPTKG